MKKLCKNHVVDGAVDGAAMAASVAAPASVRHGAETAKPQQDSSPTYLSKNQPPKNCLTSPSDAHKKDDRNANANAWHHQTGSFESMKKTMQKPCSGWSCGWSCNGSFGGSSGLRSARSRNSPTPAGFKPNLSKNQPPKNYLTSPSDAHKKDEERPTPMPDITRQAASKAWKNRAKTM